MQPVWYNDIEVILDNFANGKIDSIECIHQLNDLGYSYQEIIEEIMHDAAVRSIDYRRGVDNVDPNTSQTPP